MRGPRRNYRGGADMNGQLAVECWCRRTVVFVDPDVIRACSTASCGHPDCRP